MITDFFIIPIECVLYTLPSPGDKLELNINKMARQILTKRKFVLF